MYIFHLGSIIKEILGKYCQVRLELLELDLKCPGEISVFELRKWIVNQLGKYGEPLRWSIAAIQDSVDGESFRVVQVEAVMITKERS